MQFGLMIRWHGYLVLFQWSLEHCVCSFLLVLLWCIYRLAQLYWKKKNKCRLHFLCSVAPWSRGYCEAQAVQFLQTRGLKPTVGYAQTDISVASLRRKRQTTEHYCLVNQSCQVLGVSGTSHRTCNILFL